MNFNPETTNIIVTGAWNPSIFNVNWVQKHLCNSDDCSVSMAMPMGNPNLPPRIEFENTHLFPQSNLIKLNPIETNIKNLCDTAVTVNKIVSMLNHTPLDGLGVNFGFSFDQDLGTTKSMISLSDTDNLEAKYSIKSSQIIRALELEENKVLNFKISFSDSTFSFDFNFHHDFREHSQFLDVLNPEHVEKYYGIANSIMKDIYNYV